MEQMNKQTETIELRKESHAAQSIIGTIFGVIEIILGLRLIFKLLGANPENAFVNGIYGSTQFFVNIFDSIFSKASASGPATTGTFEPGTLIAMIIVALIAWVVMRLLTARTDTKEKRTEHTTHVDHTNQ